jgi:hypothetical protein
MRYLHALLCGLLALSQFLIVQFGFLVDVVMTHTRELLVVRLAHVTVSCVGVMSCAATTAG